MTYSKYYYSSEAISQQFGHPMVNALVNEIKKYRDADYSDINNFFNRFKGKEKGTITLTDIVKKYTNLNIKFDLYKSPLMFDVSYPVLSLDSIKQPPCFKSSINSKKAVERLKSTLGSVDFGKVWVDGFFSEIQIYIGIGTIAWRTDGYIEMQYTPEDIVSFILHEIGHLFVLFEEMLSITTRVLNTEAEVDDILNIGKNNRKLRLQLIEDISSKENLKSLPENIELVDDKTQLFKLLLTSTLVNIPSVGITSYYSNTINEYAADDFVVRMGMGKYLSSALNKSFNRAPIGVRRVNGMVCLISYIRALLTSRITGKNEVDAFLDTVMYLEYKAFDRTLYGTRYERLSSILESSINRLKVIENNSYDSRPIINDIKVIEEMLKGISENNKDGLYKTIIGTLIPSLNRANRDKLIADILKSMLNNSLTVSGIELKNLLKEKENNNVK